MIDGREVASGRADLERRDLAEHGVGEGGPGFDIRLPDSVALAAGHRIAVCLGPEREALAPSTAFVSRTSSAGNRFARTRFVPVRRDVRGIKAHRGLLLVATSFVLAALVLFLTRSHAPVGTEWDLISGRHDWWPRSFLDALNGQPAIGPAAVYKISLSVFGLHTWPLRVALLAMHILCVVLLWLLARRRLGDDLALLPASLLLVFGAASEAFMLPLQIGYIGSLALGLAAALLIDRGERRSDRLACGLLVLAWAFSIVGVVVTFATATGLIWQRRKWSSLWIVVIPLALFACWYVGYGSIAISLRALLDYPQALIDGGSATLGGLFGLTPTMGQVLLLGVAALLVHEVTTGPGPTGRTVTGAVGAGLFLLYITLDVNESGQPDAPRYLYVLGVFILWAAAGAVRISSVPRRARAVLGMFLLFAAVSGYADLVHTAARRNAGDQSLKIALGALDVAGAQAQPAFQPGGSRAPGVTVADYRAAQRHYGGSFGLAQSDLLKLSPRDRGRVDRTLRQAEGIRLRLALRTEPRTAQPPSMASNVGGSVTEGVHCLRFVSGGHGRMDVKVRPGRALLVATPPHGRVDIFVQRFAGGFGKEPYAKAVGRRRSASLSFPVDGSSVPWRIRLVPDGDLQVCEK
jgi:hypothetical protein